MKVWCDILSPKQLFLFTSIAKRFREIGYEVCLTSRHYVQLNGLIDGAFREWRILKIGSWGGGSLIGKLRASIERLSSLLDYVIEIDPDICLSSGSPEAARICYGLGIPHLMISDTPHSPVNPLAAPLSTAILTPWVIPKEEWLRAGAREEIIRYYRALDPCFWLKDFKPEEEVLDRLGVEKGRYVLMRMPESKAAYLKSDDERLLKVAKSLAKKLNDRKLIISCRYPEQLEIAQKLLQLDNVKVIGELVPGPTLTYYSMLFVGGGGTMTQEAALLGVPAISVYPQKLPAVLEFLKGKGLVIRCKTVEDLICVFTDFLERINEIRNEWQRRAKDLWKDMEDPMNVLIQVLKESL